MQQIEDMGEWRCKDCVKVVEEGQGKEVKLEKEVKVEEEIKIPEEKAIEE